MERAERGRWVVDWLWLVACGVASSVWCVTAARQIGPTFDEPLYVAHGLEGWRAGSHGGLLRVGTMPLPIDVETLPLYLYERWAGVTLNPEKDLERLLPWARAGTLVFWWLLLLYAHLAGRRLAGPWGGRLAVALLACEPSLLAHAALATTDIAVTACLLALVYHFATGRDGGWVRRVGLPAFWFAACVLSKASGLVYGPLCMLAVELHRLWALRAIAPGDVRSPARRARVWAFISFPFSETLRPLRRDAARIVGVGLVAVFLYCGSDWQPQKSFVVWTHQLPEGPIASALTWVAETLCIFPNAGEGLVRQVKHNMHGHGTYLLGESHSRALWYYFPVLLTIKLSVPLLLAPLVVALVRPRSLGNWACVTAAALIAFSLTFRVQIGIRLVLPLVALATVGVAAAAARAWADVGPGWRRLALGGIAAAGLVWATRAAIAVWPHGLCYVNELWGGTERGYLLVSDSNYDWGQGLAELAAWRRAHGIDAVDVWYFGTDPRIRAGAFRHVPFHVLPLGGPTGVAERVRGRHLAVGVTLLYGNVLTAGHRDALAFLRTQRPVARTTTFLIYDFTGDPAQASRRPRPGFATEVTPP
ncbi:MAG: glycosyltransferase family 39 protein [Gemmataceae bacterium]|nr:glycosyltransferase family 39 protein [Gemmataceae bacterium]